MPRLAFEEPKGGPLSKAAREAAQHQEAAPEAAERLDELFVEEPQEGGRHRRQPSRDTVLLILKGVTVAVAIALIGLVIVLATAGEGEPAAKAPGVPEIETSGAPPAPDAPTSGAAIVAPEVRSETTQLSVAPPPPVTQPTSPTFDDGPPGPGNNEFVRVGEPCDTPGAYAFTESFEPVVCDGRGPNDRLTWRRIFR